MRSICLALVGVLALASGVQAQDEGDSDSDGVAPPDDKRPDAPVAAPGAPPPGDVHKEGDYGGVTPGKAPAAAEAAPKKAKKPRKAPKQPTVQWVGFQDMGGGSARVFVQLSKDAEYQQGVAGDTLVVFLPGAALGNRNNGRFIDTTFFDTRIAKIEAKKVKRAKGHPAGVQVIIHFKKGGPSQADAKAQTGQDGQHFLYLDFAP
jgi:hypothetical protein